MAHISYTLHVSVFFCIVRFLSDVQVLESVLDLFTTWCFSTRQCLYFWPDCADYGWCTMLLVECQKWASCEAGFWVPRGACSRRACNLCITCEHEEEGYSAKEGKRSLSMRSCANKLGVSARWLRRICSLFRS